MINWILVLSNSLWIFALALDLSVLSYTRWQARQRYGRFDDLIKSPGVLWLVKLSGFLFCMGLSLLSSPWWEKGLWGLSGIFFVYLLIVDRRAVGQ